MNTATATQRSQSGPSLICMKMQPITTGMAAIRAQVRIFGRDSEVLVVPLVVAMFIRPTNTGTAARSTGAGVDVARDVRMTPLTRLRVEKLEDLPRTLGADARNLAEVGDRGPLDLLQGAEMMQQGALAGGTDAGDFLQACLSDVLGAPLAV